MYKINDLKKFKKAELLSIIIKSNRVVNFKTNKSKIIRFCN